MNQNDKEYLIDLLDDITVFLTGLNEKTPLPERIFDRLARGTELLEKNYFGLDKNDYRDWHSAQAEEAEDSGDY